MTGLALQLINGSALVPASGKAFKTLRDYLERGFLDLIDVYFAERMLKETSIQSENAALFFAVLMAISRGGHLCLTIENDGITPDLRSFISDPEEYKKTREALLQAVYNEEFKLEAETIYRSGNSFYLQRNWVFETRFLYHLNRLNKSSPDRTIECPDVDCQLNEVQKEAISLGAKQCVSIIMGGPGTGKTYTASRLVEWVLQSLSPLQRESYNILLTAPTGKAAAHLESTLYRFIGKRENIKCGTLHALLGIRSPRDFFSEGSTLLADLIIVDECSMIDVRLFSYLLASLKEGSRLVLMGDPDQLPSVESGSVFADLVQASQNGFVLPYTHLQKCMRSDQREILELASLINTGKAKEAARKIFDHFHVDLGLKQQDLSLIHKNIWEHVKDRFPHPSNDPPDSEVLLKEMEEFRILSCIRQGPSGVDFLNKMMFQNYSLETKRGQWLSIPIIITRNDYTMDLYNGDVGMLLKQRAFDGCGKEDYAIFWNKDGGIRTVPAMALPPHEYAYCLSVHKSQGSEYQKILLLIPPGSEVFGKEVLYTAVTRSRLKLEIDGREETIIDTVGNSCRKYSGIQRRAYEDLC